MHRKPSDSDRRRAVENLKAQYAEHQRKMGKLPSTRDVEKFVTTGAEQADKKNKW